LLGDSLKPQNSPLSTCVLYGQDKGHVALECSFKNKCLRFYYDAFCTIEGFFGNTSL
jgi:hypothetical protein